MYILESGIDQAGLQLNNFAHNIYTVCSLLMKRFIQSEYYRGEIVPLFLGNFLVDSIFKKMKHS